jgi:hypothetical protein
MTTEQADKFANPKYTREQLRAMAREYLRHHQGGDFLRTLNMEVNLMLKTGFTREQQLALMREMAQ